MEKNDVIGTMQRSVNSLQWFHTIVLSLAVISSVQQVINYDIVTSTIILKAEFFHNFIVFLLIVIPFHQGANRYLDETYITENLSVRKFTGLIDFAFFFIEAVLFYIMSLFILNNKFFYSWALLVFVIDVFWLAFVYFANKNLFQKVKPWLFLNVVAIIIISFFLITNILDNNFKWYLLAFILLLRTILDYYYSWPFYWPAFSINKEKE
jgi:hypothetical protein